MGKMFWSIVRVLGDKRLAFGVAFVLADQFWNQGGWLDRIVAIAELAIGCYWVRDYTRDVRREGKIDGMIETHLFIERMRQRGWTLTNVDVGRSDG